MANWGSGITNRFDWQSLRLPILAGLFSGILTIFFGFSAHHILEDRPAPLSEVFFRWDTTHYASIAVNGYRNTPDEAFLICFFPLLPFLSIPFIALGSHAVLALLIVSNLACIAAGIALHRLVALDYDRQTADYSVLAMLAFPTAYFLHLGYSESLFLATSLFSLLYARKNLWGAAALFAILATLTRMTGLVLLPALVIEYLQQRRFRLSQVRWSALLTLSPLLGLGIYMLINSVVLGDPLGFLHHQAIHFWRKLDWPWIGLSGDIGGLSSSGPNVKFVISIPHILTLVLATLTIIWSARRLRPCYTVYSVGIWVLTFCYSFWLSVPRYILSMFPLFIIVALLVKGRPLLQLILAFASILSYGIGLQLFVRGWWSH